MAFWTIALSIASIQAYLYRDNMNADGLAYITLGQSLAKGDVVNFVNTVWSPFYPLFLAVLFFVFRPSNELLYPVTHVGNVILVLGGLFAFRFFLAQFLSFYEKLNRSDSEQDSLPIPPAWWVVLSYSLYIYTTTCWFQSVNADLMFMVLFFWAMGMILKIARNPESWSNYLWLTILLVCNYLTKVIMFPVALVIYGLLWITLRRCPGSGRRILLSGLVFLLLCIPWILTVSKKADEGSFGCTANYDYRWAMNDISMIGLDPLPPSVQWSDFKHPPRILLESPPIYEFSEPSGATYPLWMDLYYWTQGPTLRFSFARQVKILIYKVYTLYNFFFKEAPGTIFLTFILFGLVFSTRRTMHNFKKLGVLWMPAMIFFGAYSLVHIELRYIVGPFIIIWMAGWGAIHLPNSKEMRLLIRCAFVSISVMLLMGTLAHLANYVRRVNPRFWERSAYMETVEALEKLGVSEGEKIGVIGDGIFIQSWAHLGGFRIVAELPSYEINQLHAFSAKKKEDILKVFQSAQTKAIVSRGVPLGFDSQGWYHLADSEWFAYPSDKKPS